MERFEGSADLPPVAIPTVWKSGCKTYMAWSSARYACQRTVKAWRPSDPAGSNHTGCSAMQPSDAMTAQKSAAGRWQLPLGIVAAILLSTQGLAAVLNRGDSVRPTDEDQQWARNTANRDGMPIEKSCAECGVITSVRPNEKAGMHVAVRMADGSSFTFNDTSPAKWRPGERVVIIN